MKMFEEIKFDTVPTVLAAWPGMGNVGLITVDYLRRKLETAMFAEIDMSPFFIPDSIVVKDGIAQLPEIPTSVFYAAHNPDLIIFESNAQISGREGIMVIKMLLDVLRQFSVSQIYTFAAFAQPMSHAQESVTFVTCNSQHMLDSVKNHGVIPMPDGYIAGLNGLLLGVAASRRIDAACLLGTIPSYATNLNYPKASVELVKVITKLFGIEIDVSDLQEGIEAMDQQFDMIEERIKEFIPSLNREEEQDIAEVEDEQVPRVIMDRIEQLFSEAATNREKATELKNELDRWKLFELYENRFLDLFKEKK
ncbi:MAG: PAC2 family protein [Chitinispirillaceae bacterium]|nr:PAC2 family protein [Chitinispirillaceae bacterium]